MHSTWAVERAVLPAGSGGIANARLRDRRPMPIAKKASRRIRSIDTRRHERGGETTPVAPSELA